MAFTLQPPTKRSAHTALGSANSDDTEDESINTTTPTAFADAAGTCLDFDQDDFDVTLDDLDDLDVSLPTQQTSAPAAIAPPKKKQKKAPNPDAPKRKPAAPKPKTKPPEPKAYAPKPAFAESIDHLAHKKACAPCPLCGGKVQVMWFSTVMHLEVCVDDKCFYPFNLKGNDYWSKFGGLTTTATKNKFVPVYRKHAASLPPPPEPVASAATVLTRPIPRTQPAQRRPPAPPNVHHATAAAAAASVAAKASAHASNLGLAAKPPTTSTAPAGVAGARSAATLAAARKLAGATVTAAGKTRTVAAGSRSASPAAGGPSSSKSKSKSPVPAAASAAGRPKVVPAAPVQIPSAAVQALATSNPPSAPVEPHMHLDLGMGAQDPLSFLLGQVAPPASAAAVVGQSQLPTPVVSPNSTPPAEQDPDPNSHDAFMAMLLGGGAVGDAGAIGSTDPAASASTATSELDALLGSGVNIADLDSIFNEL